MLELTLIHISKNGLDCIKIGKVWSIRVICIRRFGNLSSRLHVSNSGTRTLFDWKCGVSVFHSCNIRIVSGLWSQSNFHDMIISIINIFWLHWIINRLVVMHPYALSHNKAVLNWNNFVWSIIPQSHRPNLHETDLKPTKILKFGERSVYSRYWFRFVGLVSVYVRADKFVGERSFKHVWKISPRQIVGCLSVICRCVVGFVGERSGTCRS